MASELDHHLSDMILSAYNQGLFPMAEDAADDRLFWCDPETRGIIPLDRFHIPRRLKRELNKGPYKITFDRAFTNVIRACAEATHARPKTWINQPIQDSFIELHERGYAHSIELWHGDQLSAGIYGLKLGAAFFGESMFHRKTNASKLALIQLLMALQKAHFILFDCQFTNPHLEQFGLIPVTRSTYKIQLSIALQQQARFPVGEIVVGDCFSL